MTTSKRLKAGQTVTIKSLPTNYWYSGDKSKFKVGDKVTLHLYSPVSQTWTVSITIRGTQYRLSGFLRKHFDLPTTTAKPASGTDLYSVDAAFIKQAHAAACSEWKTKLEKQFPTVLVQEPAKVTRIRKDHRSTNNDIVAKIELTKNDKTSEEDIYIGLGLAPMGYANKCLALGEDSKFKFEIAKNGQCVILVPKKK